MIFSSRNEDGVPKWQQVMDGTATVTRRPHPAIVGKIYAVQATQGGKVLGRIRCVGCVEEEVWNHFFFNLIVDISGYIGRPQAREPFDAEAHREGFETWEGLWKALREIYGDRKLYRIEFKKVEAAL